MKIINKYVSQLVLLLSALSSYSSIAATSEKTVSSDKNERIYSTGYSSPFWQSDEFKGTHKRTLTGSHLTFELNELAGGVDTAVAGADRPGLKVSQVHKDLAVCMILDVDSEGHWWAGPKISVNWQSMLDKNEGTWYENYIIDNASMNPEEIEEWVYSIHNGKFVGTTFQDGSEYKHYIIHFKTWIQYWAVRQEYRNQGVTSIKPILDKWQSLGMKDHEFDGVKLNIEFHGPAQAKVEIDGHIPRSYKSKPDLSFVEECADVGI